jgi:glucokinase
MYKNATSIGIDIGRSQIRTAIMRYDGELLDSHAFPHKNKMNRDQLLENLIKAVDYTRQHAGHHSVNPLCVGISAKGFIDFREGIIKGPDQDIDGWRDVPLSKIISGATGLPCYIDNDANLMAIAEYNFGIASGYNNIVFVALRSGIGGAIIIDGRLYRGNNNAAGEIGQMSLNIFGSEGSEGIDGSFEDLASSDALVDRYHSLAGKDVSKGDVINNNISAKNIFELSYSGDINAATAINENAAIIGSGLGNLINIFSPEIIVLGGGMAQADDYYIDLIRENAFSSSNEFSRRDVRIERAALGNNSSLKGAAFFALTRLDGKQI